MAIGAVIGAVSGAGGLIGLILGMYPPLLDWYNQWSYTRHPTKIPDLGTVIELRFRNLIDGGSYTELFNKNGMSADYAERIYHMSEQLLPVADYIALWRRGHITEEYLDLKLGELHLNYQDIDKMKKVTEFFPAPADLITFAVREVYTPEVVDKFGQMQDLPPKFIEESKKAGLPAEQARNFWAAHWMLPSPMQGFEMLHRDIVDKDTLSLLLKSLDIMPYWREQLIKLSYNIPTRVDTRRMFERDLIDRDKVLELYRYQGYSPDDAELMTKFAEMLKTDETAGITRAAVQKAFMNYLIDETELHAFFVSFGYGEDVVNFWMEMSVYERTAKEIDAAKSELINRYNLGDITIDDLNMELTGLNLPSYYIEQTVRDVEQKQSVKLKLPARSDLETWLKLNIITDIEYTEQMRMLGYRDTDIERYLTEIAFEMDITIRKYLPIANYQRWLGTQIINVERFVQTAQEMKYSNDDIALMIGEVTEKYGEVEG